MTEVYDSCRWLNQYLGIVGFICVMWRLVPLTLDRPRWADPRAVHRILVFGVLAGFEIILGLSAGHYDGGKVPAEWFSGAFTVLHVACICMCLWWPHPTVEPQGDS